MSLETEKKPCCCKSRSEIEPEKPVESESPPESCCSRKTGVNSKNSPESACCSVRENQVKEEPSTAWERFLTTMKSVRMQLILATISGLSLLYSFFGAWEGVFAFHPAWIAIVVSGTPLIWGALKALRNRRITAGVLVSTAIVATIITGEIFAGGEVAFIMMLGHLLENWTIKRARAGIEKLVQLTPRTARKIVPEGDSEREILVDASEVRTGEVLRVLPGESVPVDGIILSGDTSIDQQLLTGEPLPVDKSAGEDVFAGTINRFGSFTMKATKVGEDSSLARMIQLVREAEMKKAPMERITDKWASILVPVAILTAVLVGIFTQDIKRAVTILVVFCPCSLILATPTAIVAAIGNAARYGILVRSGAVLEQLGKITAIAFDKTGTLTEGRPRLQVVKPLSSSWTEDSLLNLAGSLEQFSDHPLSQCITEAVKSRGIPLNRKIEETRVVPGQGITGSLLENGSEPIRIFIGNEKMLRENGVDLPESARNQSEPFILEGASVVWIALGSELCGFLSITDSLRDNAAKTVADLKNEGIDVLLLTGDHSRAANSIAEKVGITEVHSELLPEDKQRIVAAREDSPKITAMIGDGINDAPALKAANIGIAMGKIGSDIAIEAADIALIGDDISRIPFLVELSKKTIRTILSGICISMSINFIAIGLAATGKIDPVLGALIHNVGSVVVVFNASLLLTHRWKSANTRSPYKPAA